MSHSADYKRSSGLKRALLGLIIPALMLVQGCAQLPPTELPAAQLPPQKAVEDPIELTRLGDEAYSQGQFDEAQHLYKTLTVIQPESFAAWFKLGNASLHQGLSDQAERAYLEALKHDSSDPKAWYNLATARLMNARRAILGAAENLQDSDPARQLAAQRLRALNELIFKNLGESAAQTETNPETNPKVSPAVSPEANSSSASLKPRPRS